MSESKGKSLSAKIAAISKELGAIAKSGKNKEQGYAFIEYAEVSGKMRDLFDKHGIAIYPEVESVLQSETVTSKYGKEGYHYILAMKFLVVNADDQNDKFERSWLGEAIDYGDKSINKAETSGVKYFYMRLFNISEKGDSDNDSDASSHDIAKSKVMKSPEADFAKIEADVAKINDMDSLAEYYKTIDMSKLSGGAANQINKIINNRKKEIVELEQALIEVA